MKCRRVAALAYDGDAFQGLTPLAIDLGRVAADVEARCGLKRSSLSRFENDYAHNPTFLTRQRYAAALGLTLRTALANRTG